MRITGNASEGISIEIGDRRSVLIAKPHSGSLDEIRFPLDETVIDKLVGMLSQARTNLARQKASAPHDEIGLGV